AAAATARTRPRPPESDPMKTTPMTKRKPIALLLLLVAALLLPAFAGAQEATPSKLVLENSERVLSTLEARRDELRKDRSALESFISSEFDAIFDRYYAARQVLGRHGRGASAADVKLFADALADSLMRRYGSSLLDFNT